MAKLTGMRVGEFGKSITITLQNAAGVAVDISSYTTRTVEVRFKNKVISKTATFLTNGTDGKLTFNFAAGDLSEDGDWELQVGLSKTGELTKSDIAIMEVKESI